MYIIYIGGGIVLLLLAIAGIIYLKWSKRRRFFYGRKLWAIFSAVAIVVTAVTLLTYKHVVLDQQSVVTIKSPDVIASETVDDKSPSNISW